MNEHRNQIPGRRPVRDVRVPAFALPGATRPLARTGGLLLGLAIAYASAAASPAGFAPAASVAPESTPLPAALVPLQQVPEPEPLEDAPEPRGEPGEELRVLLMTMGPGEAVWERFGHNAIWIHDPIGGTDKAYNFGLFSFDQPGFIRRFIRGRMEYWMGGFDAFQTAAEYQRADRSVWVQELNLTPAQRLRLKEFLEWNERPENAYYRYDYYRDNCSTRVRDALDMVLDGALREATENLRTNQTYRMHTRRLTHDDLLVYTGLMLGLGQPVDRRISVWEEMFLPMRLMERLRDIRVRDESGRPAPLVLSERAWHISSIPQPSPRVPPYGVGFLMTGLVLYGAFRALGTASQRSRIAGGAFLLLLMPWLLLVGGLGTVLAGLWAVTDHSFSHSNENLLQANPLPLLLCALVLAGLFGGQRARVAARYVAVAIAVLAILGVVLKWLPEFYQSNGMILALTAPAHVGAAIGVWRWSHGRLPAVSGEGEPEGERADGDGSAGVPDVAPAPTQPAGVSDEEEPGEAP